MEADIYYDYLLAALNRANIPELRKIWQLSLTEKKGAIARTLITEKIPEIAQTNQLETTQKFKELYNAYKTRKMQRRVQHMPKTWIKYYLEKSNLSALVYALETNIPGIRDNEIFIDQLSRIVGGKSLTLVKEYLALGEKLETHPEYTFAKVFESAILHKNIPVVQYLFAQKESLTKEVYRGMLEAAVESGDWGWIVVALEKVQPDDWTLRSAAKGGHEEVIQFFLEKLPDATSQLLQGYMLGKNIDRVKYTLEKYTFDADTLKYALYRAIEAENKTLISLILREMGPLTPYVWNMALDSAAQQNLETLRYFYGRRKKWPTNDFIDPLNTAIYYEKVENIRFLLEKGADVSQLDEENQKNMQRLLAREI